MIFLLIIHLLILLTPILSETDDEITKELPLSSQAFIFDKSIREEPFICGGVVISVRWIISNAHCFNTQFMGYHPDPKYYAVTGVQNLRKFRYKLVKNVSTSYVDAVFQHPMYNEYSNHMDVALLKMKTSFPNYCVSSVSKDPFPSYERTCILLGWREQLKAPSNEIQMIVVKVNNYKNCAKAISKGDVLNTQQLRTFICSLTPSRSTGPCAGMYGGSLFCDGILTGVLHEDNRCDVEPLRKYLDVATLYNWIAPRMPDLVARSLDNKTGRAATRSTCPVLYGALLSNIVLGYLVYL